MGGKAFEDEPCKNPSIMKSQVAANEKRKDRGGQDKVSEKICKKVRKNKKRFWR